MKQLGLDGMPARVRRVVYSEGGRAFWGVDSSTTEVSVAGWLDGRAVAVTEVIPELEGPERLQALWEAATRAARRLCADGLQPGLVGIEKPMQTTSRGVNLPLIYAVGALQAGLFAGIRLAKAPRARWEEVYASSWKADVCGHGGFGKPKPAEVRRGVRYQAEVWAEGEGLAFRGWNEVDAHAIAAYCELVFEIRARG